ncbi:MAG: DUF3568 family protein [Planctomycetota bacterium]|jgi:hypothetical protein
MRLRTCLLVPVLAVAAVSAGLPGCAAVVVAGAAAGGVAYAKGDLEATVEAPPDVAVEATKQVFEDMGFRNIMGEASAADGWAKATTARDRDVNVNLMKRTEDTSAIKIRVSVFGDESMSDLLLARIRERIAAGVVMPAPPVQASSEPAPAVEAEPVSPPEPETVAEADPAPEPEPDTPLGVIEPADVEFDEDAVPPEPADEIGDIPDDLAPEVPGA